MGWKLLLKTVASGVIRPLRVPRVFRLSARRMNSRVKAAVKAADLDGDAFSGHSGRMGLDWMMSRA